MTTDTQRRQALDAANRIRTERAALRRKLHESKPGSRQLAEELLSELPDWLMTQQIGGFLRLFPGIGYARARWIMAKMDIRESARLSLLSDQRRAELAIHIVQTGCAP